MYQYCISFLLNNIQLYWYATFYMYVCIYSLVGGPLGCFHFLTLMKNVAINIHVQGFMWIDVFIYLGYIPRSGTARSQGNTPFSFLNNRQTIFQSIYTINIPTSSVWRVLILSIPLLILVITFFDDSHLSKSNIFNYRKKF